MGRNKSKIERKEMDLKGMKTGTGNVREGKGKERDMKGKERESNVRGKKGKGREGRKGMPRVSKGVADSAPHFLLLH